MVAWWWRIITRTTRKAVHAAVVGGTLAVGSGAAQAEGNFSQVPGFAAYFAQNPRRSTPASEAERELLQRHRPRLWLPAGHAGPIDFYGDYIAHGTLFSGDGHAQDVPVDRALLNRFKGDPGASRTRSRTLFIALRLGHLCR